jgi:hypothetical protein
MRWQAKLRHPVARSAVTAMAGLLVLAFGLLAASSALHQALHHDEASASGHCAACHLAKGHLDVADVVPALRKPSQVTTPGRTLADEFLPQPPTLLLPPGRAPPVLTVVS